MHNLLAKTFAVTSFEMQSNSISSRLMTVDCLFASCNIANSCGDKRACIETHMIALKCNQLIY